MKTTTKQDIYDFIRLNGNVRPHQLVKIFSISAVMIHRHLDSLVKDGRIEKLGKPPRVLYAVKSAPKLEPVPQFGEQVVEVLTKNYLYITPDG